MNLKTKLEQICDDVAKEKGYSRWHNPELNYLWPEVCRRYAKECCKATLSKAGENAYVMVHPRDGDQRRNSVLSKG